MSNITPVPLLDLRAQYATIREEINEAIMRVMESQYFILGPEVEALEQEVAAYSQCKFGIGMSSGTDALLVALMSIDVKQGDEIITSPYTFFATAGSIARLGAKAVFVDIDPYTFNIEPIAIEAAITKRTKAIIPVHIFGQMADMDAIMDIAHKHNLYVIEDAAQAIGSEDKGRRAGTLGHLGCFSFFPSKNLGGIGDGGMVTANDPELAAKVKRLRNHGYRKKYYNQEIGGNFRLDAIQAAALRVKLPHLDHWTAARQSNANLYRRLFAAAALSSPQKQTTDSTPVVVPTALPDYRHIYNQFVIRCQQRNELLAYLKERQIGCEIYYPVALHLQECFVDWGYQPGDFPISERAADETLALPIYPELTESMQEIVVEAIANFYQ